MSLNYITDIPPERGMCKLLALLCVKQNVCASGNVNLLLMMSINFFPGFLGENKQGFWPLKKIYMKFLKK
jgi:hypothetical protein